jgi:hypothetical protein
MSLLTAQLNVGMLPVTEQKICRVSLLTGGFVGVPVAVDVGV